MFSCLYLRHGDIAPAPSMDSFDISSYGREHLAGITTGKGPLVLRKKQDEVSTVA